MKLSKSDGTIEWICGGSKGMFTLVDLDGVEHPAGWSKFYGQRALRVPSSPRRACSEARARAHASNAPLSARQTTSSISARAST